MGLSETPLITSVYEPSKIRVSERVSKPRNSLFLQPIRPSRVNHFGRKIAVTRAPMVVRRQSALRTVWQPLRARGLASGGAERARGITRAARAPVRRAEGRGNARDGRSLYPKAAGCAPPLRKSARAKSFGAQVPRLGETRHQKWCRSAKLREHRSDRPRCPSPPQRWKASKSMPLRRPFVRGSAASRTMRCVRHGWPLAILVKNIRDDFLSDGFGRCEKQIIDHGVIAILHGEWLGHEAEAGDVL